MKHFDILLFLILVFTNGHSQVPANYYDSAVGKSCAALKSALKYIITQSHTPISDDNLLAQYALTDIKPREVGTGSTSVIWDIYADNPNGSDPYNYNPSSENCGNYNSEGDCYNKEHTIPKSWSDDDEVTEGDYHHVVPADGWVNSKRSNFPFGVIFGNAEYVSLNGSKLGNSGIPGITGKVFEPIDEYKGDMARCFFYFITRYQDLVKTKWADNSQVFAADSFPTVNINYLPIMLAWHMADPVSDKELIRNEGGFTYQGNRNPFIDHPEYVNAIWNSSCPGLSVLPVSLVTFTGVLNQHMVDLDWYVANVSGVNSFEVQSGFNGKIFTTIASLPYTGLRQYHYSTPAVSGISYYRLAWKNGDGNYSFSSVIQIDNRSSALWRIIPNPAKGKIWIEVPAEINETVSLSVFNLQGQQVYLRDQKPNNGKLFIEGIHLLPGFYYVRCRYGGGDILLKMIVTE